MTRARRILIVVVLPGAAAVLVGCLRFALRARVPDDYDSIGFVLALDHFDLARFQPQFPGYPVYVALGKVAHLLWRDPLAAAEAISVLAASATAAGLFALGRRAGGEVAGWGALGLYAGAALPWLSGGAPLSDGTGAAFALGATWALVAEHGLVAGILLGLMLGARASYWPLALSFMIAASIWRRREWARAIFGSVVGVAAWAAPLVAVVGPRALGTLARAHLRGHFGDWGGSVATEPHLGLRFWSFARALFFDGLAPRSWALAALMILLALAHRRILWKALALACAPYAVWILLGQNVVEQPRHLLPLEVALVLALALTLSTRTVFVAVAVVVVAAASAPEAWAHAHTAPPAEQAAEWVATNQPDALTFGGRSMRFFALRGLPAGERTWLSEVDVSLERVDRLPKHVLVTSEVAADPRRSQRLTPGPRFCRAGLFDGGQPCLQLFEYSMRDAP